MVLIDQLKAQLLGRRWTVLYKGTDAKRYTTLVQQLTAAQIPHQMEEFDQLAKAMTASPIPGRSPMDNINRRDQLNFNATMTVQTRALRNNTATTYRILVRERDVSRARNLK